MKPYQKYNNLFKTFLKLLKKKEDCLFKYEDTFFRTHNINVEEMLLEFNGRNRLRLADTLEDEEISIGCYSKKDLDELLSKFSIFKVIKQETPNINIIKERRIIN